ncbi:hypothetical protein D7Z26_06725 [Cohnella endophytica]|uniref:Uncharacterized protein n=1 Tax=Cohnella endophytica TaxID=2419778 RepID=A0A494XY91_9BACL|nr:hypothetical protein [Cohnella endophytica]RKP54929.1 hypothetical protein D7Z26_06725 [Cohnella endophytica]
MLYERLVHIYNTTNCRKYYPVSSVDNLYRFIQQSLDQRKKNVSPYGFANFSGFSVENSIQFFMYFSNRDGIFDIIYFFECSKPTCGNRVYLSTDDLNSGDNMISCDECDKEYIVEDIQEFIKAYYAIRKEFLLGVPRIAVTDTGRKDPNSTFQVIKGLTDDLKWDSPSSLSNHLRGDDEGECTDPVTLDQIVKGNIDNSGEAISDAVQTFLDKMYQRYE